MSEIAKAVQRGELKGGYVGNSATIAVDADDLERWLSAQSAAGKPVSRAAAPGPRQTATAPAGDPVATWEHLVATMTTQGGMSRQEAVRELAAKCPDLHQQYVASFNAAAKQREQADAQRIDAQRRRLQHA